MCVDRETAVDITRCITSLLMYFVVRCVLLRWRCSGLVIRKKAGLSVEELEAGIRQEYAKNYLWTGDINEGLYEVSIAVFLYYCCRKP